MHRRRDDKTRCSVKEKKVSLWTRCRSLCNSSKRRSYTIDKYQLSLIDPRDRIVPQTELNDLCDKLQWSSVAARRCYQLSWPTTIQFSTLWASIFVELSWQHASTIDMLWRNWAKFQREVPLFLKVLEFRYNTDMSKEAPALKTSSIRSAISIEHRLVTDTHRDRLAETQGHS